MFDRDFAFSVLIGTFCLKADDVGVMDFHLAALFDKDQSLIIGDLFNEGAHEGALTGRGRSNDQHGLASDISGAQK